MEDLDPGATPPTESPPDPTAMGDPETQSAESFLTDAIAPDDADSPTIIRTDEGAKDGLSKCERCGSTEISLNIATSMLRCDFCRHEFAQENAADAFDLNGDIGSLKGVVIGSGSTEITPSTEIVLTFKCSACGAEVVIDTASSMQSRCHWCRNTLSTNQQIPNGAVPDMVLPFKLTKESAVDSIKKFVGKRKFFANPRFTEEFNPENVMGVYLPYMILDVNAHAVLSGQGEHQTRSYSVKNGDKDETRYDADRYDIVREFDIHINDLTVESSVERQNQNTSQNSNNIINTIMPFDVENAVRYDSNYLAGFTSERRDSNVDDLLPIARTQTEDITRHRIQDTLKFYDRGVRWGSQEVDLVGQRWVSAYLPVWLYSYLERKDNGKEFLHYVAVNARTGETMGSVPVNQRKLLAVSGAVQMAGIVAFIVFKVVGG